MFLTLLLWAFSFIPLLAAIPTTSAPLQKRCTNALTNPSFESGESPWLAMAFGSWAQRGVYTSPSGGHDGNDFYYGEVNATVADATLTVSQSSLSLQAGSTVDCSAWVASNRPGNTGSTRVEVFLDEKTCGSAVYLGTSGWTKVGGKITVDGTASHTFAVVVLSDEAGPDGAMVWIDEAVVGNGWC
ncbi:hypothetical protein EK21DRAFT_102978 [Setomelanomma holmii]|uniref:Uncharacterized protein n=1 Tax=Setomelanomma holmii TaxID=210430 RepID=A0A9P4LJN8_9PLEO|nr:hypothetical protein EK21DRAFT_102978 [Setomelanomma holmii]